jgi:hypothetical protein
MILLRVLKYNRVGGVATIILIALGLFLSAFIRQPEPAAYSGMPFYRLLFGSLHLYPFLNRLVALLILFILCYMLVRIAGKYLLLDLRSFMPATFFLFFTAVFPSAQQVSPPLVGSVFYLMCFSILFNVHDKPPDTFSVFVAGLILALGSMFYLQLIWFVPLIWISLGTLRPVTWRELLYPLISYFILGLFLLVWFWAIRDNGQMLVRILHDNLAVADSYYRYHSSAFAFYGYFFLLVGIASIYMARRFQTRKTVVQNIYQVLFYMFVGGILFFIFMARLHPSGLVFVSFPVAYLMSNYLHRKKNHWIHELILWILIGGLVFVQLSV